MVGIVLVSHSNKLVEGLKDLISQMAVGVKICVAGGTDDGRIGTDPMKIMSAIEEVIVMMEFYYSLILEVHL